MRPIHPARPISVVLMLSLLALASPAVAQDEAPAPASGDDVLTGVVWNVVAHGPSPPQTDQTVRFEAGGGLSVSTGCATYTGIYSVEGAALSVEGLRRDAGSLEDCSFGERGSADLAIDILEKAESWALADGKQLVIGAGGQQAGWQLTLEAGEDAAAENPEETTAIGPGELAGTWRLRELMPAAGQSLSVPEEIVITLDMGAGGIVGGSGGCSEYEATYTIVGGETIRIAEVSAAEAVSCDADLAGLQELYLALLPVLDGVSLEDDVLTLSGAMLGAELTYDREP